MTSTTRTEARRTAGLPLAVGAAALGCWVVTAAAAAWMHNGPRPMLPPGGYAAMWAVMTVAMMGPVAALDVLAMSEPRPRVGYPAGHLLAWVAAGVPFYWVARAAQQLSSTSGRLQATVASGLLAGAAIYQSTARKRAALVACKAHRVRDVGLRGGLAHGLRCLQCTAPLMSTLLVFGLMNVAAMATLCVAVLVERAGPRHARFVIAVVLAVFAVAVWTHPALARGLHPATDMSDGM